MPVFNLTIDDTCPLIQYTLWWSDSSNTDSFISDYVNSTFHATDIQSATASLTFNGSAVYIYGAKRPNHDVYAVTLDQTTVTANGNSGDGSVNLFNQLLFSQTGLDESQAHTVTLKNQYTTSSASWVDVDYMLVTAGDGNENTESIDTVWDDGNDGIVYSTGWDATPNNLADQYYMGTMHVTTTSNAYASIIFTGNAIAVYGATSGNHGLYSVSLDGHTPLVLNGTATTFRPQNLLYWAGSLPDGQHNVTITSISEYLDLDKVVLSKWPSSEGNASSSSTATSSSASSSHTSTGSGGSDASTSSSSNKTAVGPIVGGVVAGVAVLAIVLATLLFFLRRRRRRGLDRIVHSESMKGDPEPFTIEPFNGARNDTRDVNERSPLSPGNIEHDVMRSAFSGSLDASRTQGYSRSEFGAQSDSSKYIFPQSITNQEQDSPHRDFPPPDYEQATAGAAPRPLPVPIGIPRPSLDITMTGQSSSSATERVIIDTPDFPRKS
ncbi:hypothetical protein PHLGIDRAFT_232823 [Phlebiopsis gigantea 11061_1 CR5-6]|uniref:Transmembrane protein n=1 Tax=Phlebiopsis gigantea (strain 11061_1 CR5-6) TaxID=745531 RepID=A0A0C3PSW8_PHLG1|nr:hypothetical protein PHLGIDRAFT_232823 [Phlebiopsis gigantea 11061_1 CR5-6]